MRYWILLAALAGGAAALAGMAGSQEGVSGADSQNGSAAQHGQNPNANMTPQQRAAATRAFLGLGVEPDKAAAERGAPLFTQNCSFCHGPQARGATGPSLITSDMVLDDDHGEHLIPFLRKGRPEKGMPSFATMTDQQLKDIAEFIHLQVEDVANRGTYHVLNILVGNAEKGQAYVEAHCLSCHTMETFLHIGSKFRSPDQLQRGWIWPPRPSANSLAVTATVKAPDGGIITGRVKEVSDFRITLIDKAGQTHVIDRDPNVTVEMKDPLAGHQAMIMTLKNDDMHNVTAYLETLK
jgi:cytochrome c oxidase cbb3-type subunit III